jgi:ribosomal protein L37AE/L43A
MKLRTGDSARRIPPRPVNFCAQCGEPIYIAGWSEYVDDRRVRHLWNCEDCGYTFETTVCYPVLPKA